MDFIELPLHKQVLEGTKAAGFTHCMPVQEKVLPVTLDGYDVMVQSKTGSGKTAVYVLTFLEKYLRNKDEGKNSSCLIIAPTRELAQQISEDALILCSKVPGFHIGTFYGGVGYEHQRKQLEMGCDIYVGTPGRLLEYMEHHEFDGKKIDTFVIDEADRMFDMGFYPDIKRIFRHLPQREERQTMLFSATLEVRVRELAWEFMNEPEKIDLEPDHITVESITQELYHVAKSQKFGLFLQLLEVEKPESAIIFTNSRHMAEEISNRLKLNGYNSDFLTGDLPQAQRQKALDKLKDGKTSFLVATDVAARGLQIDDLPLVVNYDIPEDYENYVHRIGRTARAGKSGKAITLADEEFVYGLEAIEKYIKMKIPVIWPENLPEVEDKSLGKSWGTSRHRNCQNGHSGGSQRNASKGPRNDHKQSQKASHHEEKKDAVPKNKSDYKSLGSMTEQERMEYYKKKYGFEPSKSDSQKKQQSKPQQKAPSQPKKVEQNQPKQQPEPKKKVGLFSRLFKKKESK